MVIIIAYLCGHTTFDARSMFIGTKYNCSENHFRYLKAEYSTGSSSIPDLMQVLEITHKSNGYY